MKVLHLIDSGGLYGAEQVLLTLVSEQMKAGLSPMIISAGLPDEEEKPLERAAKNQGLPVTPWRMAAGFNLEGARELVRWARADHYDLLHSHGYKFNVLMGLWPSRYRGVPLVATLHGYIRAPRFTKGWCYERLDRLVLGRMDHVVLVSEAMRSQLPARIGHSDNSSVIANGINTARVQAAAAAEIPDDLSAFVSGNRPLILGVGRLSHEKGFDRLLEALSILAETFPNAGLLIIGEGPARAGLEAQATALGLSGRVRMPGYVDAVPAVMANADVLCMPSRTEGLPITLLEAMCVGLPVVASRVGDMPAVMGDGRGGRLLDSGSPVELAKALSTRLGRSEEVRRAVEWSRLQVAEHYSESAMMREYETVYRKVLA
ncbi:MAG: glycosyltransferase [Marinobacter sp.]|uniref:glycosyltransferase n=1 Tax=Marinobacter sp. TaxID=50741 RepID=UPI00299EA4E3|nr:glycosyltransferase [Marinobacter sp.]MDX1754881.1 glycosyltransferase [Marinobacter sp.]